MKPVNPKFLGYGYYDSKGSRELPSKIYAELYIDDNQKYWSKFGDNWVYQGEFGKGDL